MPWRFPVCQALGVNHSLDLPSLICNKNHTLGKKKFLFTLTVWHTVSSFEGKKKKRIFPHWIFEVLMLWLGYQILKVTLGAARNSRTSFIYIYWKKSSFHMREWKSLFFFVNQGSLFSFTPTPFEVLPASLLLSFTQNIKSNIQRKEAAKDKSLKIKPATGKCAFKVSARL